MLSGVTGGLLGCVPQRLLRASLLAQRKLAETHLIVLGLVHIKEQPQSTQTPLRGVTLLSPFIKELRLLTGFSLQDQYSQFE